MSLFDSASLVVTPNGYKEDKLYSIKPTDGSGDLVVTRATTATRVNSAGLIEQVPYNLLTYSEDYTNANWIKENATITTNAIASPNGTLTADLITSSSSSFSDILQATSQSSGNTYTLSCYAKKGTTDWIFLRLTFAAAAPRVWFNLNTGTIGTISSGLTASIENVGNGWYRCSITGIASATPPADRIDIALANADTSTAPNVGSSAYIWGAQLVTGTSAKEYFPTTDRLNVPRLDYTNSSCPSILVEPQRTNITTYSEQFDNGGWTKYIGSVTANATTSPSGLQNADKFIDSTDNEVHALYKAYTISGDTTFSIYVKSAEYSKIAFTNLSDGGTAKFDISNGTIISTSAQWKNSTIQNVGNGWYRIASTTNGVSGSKAIGTSLLNSSNQEVFVGTGTSGIFLWGAQVEAGSYATSYIPTVASSVTRNADVISKTGISSLIGQTEGTLFAEINLPNPLSNGGKTIVVIGTSPNRIYIAKDSSTQNILQLATESASGYNFINTSAITTSKVKIAIAYKSGDNAFYVNGSLISSASATTNPTSFSKLLIGDETPESNTDIKINSVQLYKTRLSNSELAQLTTL